MITQVFASLSTSSFTLLLCGVLVAWLYGWKVLWKRQLIPTLRQNIFLTLLVVQGLVWCMLSFLGVFDGLQTTRSFMRDISFLPRQAYYLAFLPVISAAALCDMRKVFAFVREHNVLLAALYLLYKLVVTGTVELNVTEQFLLCSLSLAAPRTAVNFKVDTWKDDIKNNYPQWILFAAVLALPAAAYGTSTIYLLRALYAALFLLRSPHWMRVLASFTIPVVLIVSFVVPFVPSLYSGIQDANIRWRLEYWHDEDTALIDTFGIGMGYGTTYASKTMIDANPVSHYTEICPVCGAEVDAVSNTLHGNGKYTDYERPFVTASHNSFVSLTFRLGIIGLCLFCLFLGKIWRGIFFMRGDNAGVIFLFCGAIAVISLNVGLESPGYYMLFLMAMAWSNVKCSGQSARSDS